MSLYTEHEIPYAEQGDEIARVLRLKKKTGRYVTEWGDKTALGLYRCVAAMVYALPKEKE